MYEINGRLEAPGNLGRYLTLLKGLSIDFNVLVKDMFICCLRVSMIEIASLIYLLLLDAQAYFLIDS